MKLNDTVAMMYSDDYKERFKAEYLQLRIRIKGLSEMLENYKNGTLSFIPTCNIILLNAQLQAMNTYSSLLVPRARAELIELD